MMEPLAEAIRKDSNISGINVTGHIHKIGLFSDDVVLTLTNPASSLASVQSVVQDYGAVSNYKLKITTSCILPVNVPNKTNIITKRPIPLSNGCLKQSHIKESNWHPQLHQHMKLTSQLS